MASSFTPIIDKSNVHNVREQIALKKSCQPHLATVNDSAQVLTDYDTFPYPRWFRGIPDSSQAIVAEREAGWRPRHDDCYKVLIPKDKNTRYPNHCFEGSCSVTYPCYPEYLTKYADREALNVILNKTCISQYR